MKDYVLYPIYSNRTTENLCPMTGHRSGTPGQNTWAVYMLTRAVTAFTTYGKELLTFIHACLTIFMNF